MSDRFDPAAELATVEQSLDAMSVLLGDDGPFHARAESISAWSVGQQIEHTLLALESSLGAALAIEASGRGEGTAFDIVEIDERATGLALLVRGKIPRGRAKAFKRVSPGEQPIADDVRAKLDRVREIVANVKDRLANLSSASGRVVHPLLGAFDAVEWLRFSSIHTAHHLEISIEIWETMLME